VAVEYVVPYAVARDLVTYKVAVSLFSETGYSVSETTLRRWVREERLPVERAGRTDRVSFSDLLMVHAERVTGRDQ
jgi:transposase-like protein